MTKTLVIVMNDQIYSIACDAVTFTKDDVMAIKTNPTPTTIASFKTLAIVGWHFKEE